MNLFLGLKNPGEKKPVLNKLNRKSITINESRDK